MEKEGCVHVYTGNGKGKTTAALGLLLRAAGAGWTVFLGQFLKKKGSSEHKAISRLGEGVTVRTFGGDRAIGASPSPQDSLLAREGLAVLREALESRQYDLVIADEILVAASLGILPEGDVLGLLEARPASVELVLTGRDAFPELLRRADLVTEMREVRHYFRRGLPARRGIEK